MIRMSYLLLSLFFVWSDSSQAVEIRIHGIESNSGVVRIAFYDSEDTYLDEEKISFAHEEVVTKTGDMIVKMEIPEGEYSIAVYHDVNGNKSLDKNMFGIPKEPYGFSNNVMGNFGPPSFEQAMVSIPQMQLISINLR